MDLVPNSEHRQIKCFLSVMKQCIVLTSYYLLYSSRRQKKLKYDDLLVVDSDEEKSYVYDVFVCYAATEKEWVFSSLLPILEQRFG